MFYAQAWALGMWMREGERGSLAAKLSDVLRDATEGRLLNAVESIAGAEAAQRTRIDRAGSGVLVAYVDADVARASGRFAAFQAEILRPGGRERVALGRSPIRED
ncbi:hypothetical protein J4558_12875 [Leptolyngbya sp. 15MV]|nr:hypothetical protein J4558_12875 [Leptolyngbya sp. 15MV]